MNKSFKSLCMATFVCSGLAAQSIDAPKKEQQQDSILVQNLDEVVVSDSRFAMKREYSGKTVITISSKELEKNQGKSVAELINTKSGIEINGSRSRSGEVIGVYARGGRGRQVLILIDGVRVTDPSSSSSVYDLRMLATSQIASIEIIKGAASTLYGTSAATAVISITTKKSKKDGIALGVQSSIGTNQTAEDQNYNASSFTNSAQLSGTVEKFSYSAAFSQQYADGLSSLITDKNLEDSYSRYSADLRLGYTFLKDFDVQLAANRTHFNTEFDEGFGMLDAPYNFISEQERIALSSTYRYHDSGALHLNAGYAAYNSESKSAFPNTFEGQNLTIDLYNKYNFSNRFFTIIGLNYIKDETEFSQTALFEITDPYANLVYLSDFGLHLNIGARMNNHSEYGSHLVYNFNPSFTLQTKRGYLKALASYATSYVTPTLTQLFGNFGANANLEPENNRTIEGGFEYSIGNTFRMSSLYFNRKEENFVFYDNLTSTYSNAKNTIDAQGVEVEVAWNALKNINFTANYTFTERKGDAAIRIPKHKINAVFDYTFSQRVNASLGYSLTGERSDTDFGSFPFVEVPLEAFSLVDFYVGYNVIPNKMKLFFNANNIMNETYTEVLGFTTKGRNINVGFSLDL